MVLKANLAKLVIGDLVLKAKLVLILTALKVKFDCILKILLIEMLFTFSAMNPSFIQESLTNAKIPKQH